MQHRNGTSCQAKNRFMIRLVFLMLLVTMLFSGCSKDDAKQEANAVWVRIENVSGNNFENGRIALVDYGPINEKQVTEYKKIDDPIYAIMCLITINGNLVSAGVGVCGSPLPPPLSNGYYTLKIMRPSQGFYQTQVTQQ